MKYDIPADISSAVPLEYEILRSENISAIDSTAALLRHRVSGARVAVISNNDPNKLFLAGFLTPPEDNCGTPHIIEHSVLCGSERYPVKDPFMELVRSSVQTFLNAMTYPDKTVYPVSSCNDADFKNLMNVYLDAVFAPQIAKRREIFMQEGWHFEPNSDRLGIGGVVYSEMKGAVSSPDSNIYDEIIYALFPNTAYANNSGGDPEAIPNLTYDAFLDFYRRHYHPSNSYIVLYGDMDIRERLEYMDREYLSHRPSIEADFRRDCNVSEYSGGLLRRTVAYPTPIGDDTSCKTYLAYGAAVADSCSAAECYALDILTDILIDSPGSPVKTALNAAGIGQEVYGEFINHIRRPAVTVVAKNTDPAEEERFLNIIVTTLETVVREGVNRKSLEAAIERSEFHFREGEQTSASRGLSLSLSMLQSWMYTDEEPFRYLKLDEIFLELRRWLKTDHYEELTRRIINSSRRALLMLTPEAGMNERLARELQDRLDIYRKTLNDDEYARLVREYRDYTEYQDRAESEGELSCIPYLSRSDMAREPEPIFNRSATFAGIPAVIHEIPTDSLVYLRLMFDLSAIPAKYLPYLDLLTDVLGKTDTACMTLPQLQDEVRLAAGGLSFGPAVYRIAGSLDRFRHVYEIGVKMLPEKAERVMELIEEIVCKSKLDNRDRLREILAETVSEKQRDIISSGSEYAVSRSLAYHSPADALEDMTSGISSYLVQSELLSNFSARADETVFVLNELIKMIFDRRRCTVSIAADPDDIDKIESYVSRLVERFIGTDADDVLCIAPLGGLNEGFMTPSKVQYVAATGNLFEAGYEYRGAYQVMSAILKNSYLYPAIRMRGGAYGYSFTVSHITGNVAMATYRDPCLSESLSVFGGCGDYIRSLKITDSELDRAVIGTVGRLDRPLSPYLKVARSLSAFMSGVTYEDICSRRADVLSVTARDIASLADPIDAVLRQGHICVIGNEEKIADEASLFGSTVRLP